MERLTEEEKEQIEKALKDVDEGNTMSCKELRERLYKEAKEQGE